MGGRRKEWRKEGRGRYALVGLSHARALSSPLMLLLLGPHHSVVVGAHCCLGIGLGCSVLPWAVAAVARFGVVGAHVVVCICVCGLLLVIVGMDVRGQLVAMCTFVFKGSGWLLWAVDGHFV